jgi:two-component system NtrC family sensor kinase
MAHERILIVDNSPQTIDFIVNYVLKPNNYQVLIAKDGDVGLKMAIEHRPDLILLDMNMPRMTGIEVLEAMNVQNIKIPVIVMTFHGSETLAVQFFRMGVKDYILKPFTIAEILESIENALTEVRLRRERDELTRRLRASNQALEQRLKELNTLFGIGKSVTLLLDHDKLLSRLVEAAIFLTSADEGTLLLVDPETEELYIVASRGLDERVVRSLRLKVSDSLAGKVITTGQPLMLTGQDLTRIKTSYLVRSLIYIPLRVKEQVIGVLGVSNRHQNCDFTNHDLRLLSALADYAAISLENVRLFNQVENERTKLAAILGEIAEPVVVIGSRDDQIIMANAAFQRIIGLEMMAAEGQALTQLLASPTLLDFITTISPMDSSRKAEILLEDGRTFYATLTPIPEVGRAIIMQDVTHFKKLDRMKSDFVFTISHDLRLPLASVKEYTEMLRMAGKLNEKQTLFMDRIASGLEHMTTLIDNLLDLNVIESGGDPNKARVDLGEVTRQVVANFQNRADSKRQQLVCHCPDEPALVVGNTLRLQQVISNLVDNALRYTPEKGQISTLVQVEDNRVIFKIADNGPGISPVDLPFVFDKFFRVNKEDERATKRPGLGLAICKSIIESYQGHIWVESQPEQGSAFIFTLPLALVDEGEAIRALP